MGNNEQITITEAQQTVKNFVLQAMHGLQRYEDFAIADDADLLRVAKGLYGQREMETGSDQDFEDAYSILLGSIDENGLRKIASL